MELLERYFDAAFAAPDGIKRLRELILTLAMQGRLVPQDPNDPPARELLAEIEAEKRRLVKEGKIKPPKPLPEIRPEEVPYELPPGWEWVRIRDICHDWGQKIPDRRFTYIDVGSIDNKRGAVSETVQLLEGAEAPSRARKLVRTGTVIYSTVRPYLLNVAIIERQYENQPIASTAFAIVHPFSGVNNRFIYLYLRSPSLVRYVEETMKGVAYPAISDGAFFRAPFCLPPLAEQGHIVAKVDQLMTRCDELEKLRTERDQKRRSVHTAALKRLFDSRDAGSVADAWQFLARNFGELHSVKDNVAELRKAILQLAVMGRLVLQDPNDPPASELLKEIEAQKRRLVKEGKIKAPKPIPEIRPEEVPYELPAGWEWVRLGEIGDTNIGLTYSPADVSERGVPVLRSNNIQNGVLDLSDLKRVGINVKESVLVRESDLLICARNGSKALVGKAALIAGLSEQMAFGAFMAIFRSRFNEYLLHFINSPLFRQMIDEVNTMTINQITQQNLRNAIFPLPPLPEQRRIVAKVDHLMALCDALEREMEAAAGKQTELLDAVMAQV